MTPRSISRVLAVVVSFAALAAQAANVGFTPPHTQASVGEIFSITVAASGFDENLDGGGLSLEFDPAVVSFVDATFDPDWDFFTDAGVLDTNTGTLSDMQFNQFAHPQVGAFDIVTLRFEALALGNSGLTLAFGSNPFASAGEVVAVTLGAGSVTVVPLPAAGGLLLLGLAPCAMRLGRKDTHRRHS